MTDIAAAAGRPTDRSLLIVENDKCALESLARTMEGCGFTVTTAESVADGLQQIERASPAFAVVELTFADGHGLALISALKLRRSGTRAIALTSHGGYCNCGRSRETRRRGLSHQAGQCQRRRRGRGPTRRGHRRVRTTGTCLPTVCVGSTFSASTSSAAAVSRKRRAGSACIGVRCSAFWRDIPRSNFIGHRPEDPANTDYAGKAVIGRRV
jgi:CheY-like chemotaxis protein